MSTLLRGQSGRLRWQVLPDWHPLLFGAAPLRFAGWCQQGRVKVVKDAGHRTVYLVEISGRAFYVKQYRRTRLFDRLAYLVRPSAARREWHKAAEIARRGISTVKPIAWAEERRGGMVRDSFLITEALEEACPLDRYLLEKLPRLAPAAQPSARRTIVESLARFVAAIHRAGIFHDDFHAGNVLVTTEVRDWESGAGDFVHPSRSLQPPAPSPQNCLRPDTLGPDPPGPAGPLKLFLIDVPGVRFYGPLRWPASRKNLVVLCAAWRERLSRSDRLRFWRTYLAERPDLRVPEERAALEGIERASREYSRRVTRRRDKRAFRINRDYAMARCPYGRAHGVADLPRRALERLLEDPEAPLRENLDCLVKISRTKLIVQADLPLSHGPVHVAYKQYEPRNRWKAFWGMFRRSRAVRGWYWGQALLQRGIATARPIAVCDVRRAWHRRRSYLATEWIEGARNVHEYGWRLADRSQPGRLRRAACCAESLGKLIGRLHACGMTHGDLKAANLLVVDRGEDLQAYLIDVEDVRIHRRLGIARAARDLARLATSITAHPWVSRTTLFRFLRAYVRQSPPGTLAWKPLWRRIARRTRRLIARKRRRAEGIL